MTLWDDFSDKEKLEWLRARVTQLKQSIATLTLHTDELGALVGELERKKVSQEKTSQF
jgi:hypothetical protein